MKDFAKSIHVGNAGDVIHRDGDFKIKYNEKEDSYELYFNSIYYDTFHTKQQALDKIELYKRRKEARNSKIKNSEIIKDGNVWVVLYAEGTKSKEFDNEQEAKKFAAQLGNSFSDKVKFLFKDFITMSDSNGEKITIRKDGDVIRKSQPNNEFSQIYIEHYNSGEKAIEEFKKKGFKVLNDTPAEYAKRPPKIVGGNSLPEELEKDVEKKDKEKIDEIEKLEKTRNSASEYEILKQDPSKMHPLYKKAYEEALRKLSREDEDFKKRLEREYGIKAKNSASEDKFAYVMREFADGKLKTPDGKVVTDPEQAKAIAYSESKKTENGLARARNAIKK